MADRHIRARPGDKILDLGCGRADILPALPDVVYVGIDNNPRYIEQARRRFPAAELMCASFEIADELTTRFDLVLALGLLHHLDDDEAQRTLQIAHDRLRPGGRFVAVDPYRRMNQSRATRWVLSMDRGESMRSVAECEELFKDRFDAIEMFEYSGLLRIPFDHLAIEATRA